MISHNLHSNCVNARIYYYDFLGEQTRAGIPGATLEHIIQCAHCQNEVNRLRTLFERADSRITSEQSQRDSAIIMLLKLHFAYIGEPVKCNTVKPFLAGLADPVLQIRTRTPITVHLDECRACRDDLRNLRDMHLTHEQLCHLGQLLANEPTGDAMSCSQAQVVCDIARRPDSGVITCLTFREQPDTGAEAGSNDVFADRRIKVKVLNPKKLADIVHPDTRPDTASGGRKQTIPVMHLRRYLKPAIAAAAVILIALGLFFSTPIVEAVDFGQIVGAIEKAGNVCTMKFSVDSTEPIQIQKIWVSQASNISLFDTRGQYVLLDVANRIRKEKLSPSGPVETTDISPEKCTELESQISHSFGLLPVSRISDLPRGAQWNRVDEETLEISIAGTEVYDLIWTKGNANTSTFNKLRVFVDMNTDLPKRTEFYSRHGFENKYHQKTFTTITYPKDDEIEAVIASVFDQ
ncbi:MAG: hypothetical protein ACYSW0_22790 [Planctomycetota bacterium]